MNDTLPATPPQIATFSHRFIPATQTSQRLIVVLHGLGDSSAGFLWMPEHLRLPWLNFLLLDAPQPYVFDGFSWYDIQHPAPGVQAGRALLVGLFGELAAQGWRSEEIVLFGFSQGCLMAIDFALRWPRPLAGVVGVSGQIHLEHAQQEMHPQALRQAWLVTHGMFDPLLPPKQTKAQVEQLRALGLDIAWHEFGKDHSIDFYKELPLLREWIAARWSEPTT